MIVVVSHSGDDHAKAVLSALRRVSHPVVLVDTGRFPSAASLELSFDERSPRAVLSFEDQTVDFADCSAVWWRRPQAFTLETGISPDASAFALTECHEAISGLWALIEAAWVNPPGLDETAHHKPYQLAVARRMGWSVPRTLITNDPAAARAFIARVGASQTIYKTFLASEQCWRETRRFRNEEEQFLDLVRLAPVIFQEYIPAVADVRVTVVGDRVFATEITAAKGGYEVDYRMDLEGATFRPTALPPTFENAVRAFVARLGLVYGAIDLRRTPDGRYVFLEINPAGEWLFVEERTGQPIAAAMAELLIRLDTAARVTLDGGQE